MKARICPAQVVSCCVYEITKQKRQCIEANCLTVGQTRAISPVNCLTPGWPHVHGVATNSKDIDFVGVN